MTEAEATTITAEEATEERGILSRVFFGWWVVTAGSGLQFLGAILLGQAYGTYKVLLQQEFGWSSTLLSGAASMREAESGLTGPVQGWLIERFGPKRVAQVGVITFGIGFMLLSRIHTPLTFYLAFIVMAVGASLSGYLTVTYTVVQWFDRRRATAIGLASAGFAIAGMSQRLFVPVLEAAGWRTTAFFSGIVIIVIGFPLTWFLVASPSEKGLAPDGDPPGEPKPRGHAPTAADGRPDHTLGEALRTRAFWFISLGHASALFIVSSMSVHLPSHLKQSQGFTLTQASSVWLALSFMFLVGTVTGGWMGDKFNKRYFVVVCLFMHMSGLLLLSHAVNIWMIIGFILLHGLAWGWRGPQMAAIRADYFGRSAFGKILGASNGIIIIGTISGPLLAGYIYDRTGSYQVGFDILAAIAMAGSIFFILAPKPDAPVRQNP